MISNEIKKRYNAFWDRTSYERCILFLSRRLKSGTVMEGVSVKDKWTDIERRTRAAAENCEITKYYAEGFPTIFTNFGPGCMSACIGGDFVLAESTIWFDRNPIITNWEKVPKILFDDNSEMWKLTYELTKMLGKESLGRYHTSISDIGGSLDIVASLRGTLELLYDLVDYPEQVKKVHLVVEEIWKEVYTLLYNESIKYQEGMTSWMPIWCKKRYYPLQCDFCAMISPDMFDEFVKPSLVSQTEWLDHSIYHLDGPGEVCHLDSLLDIQRLDAIQWTPGDGRRPISDEFYFDMYNKILRSGKGLVLFSVPLSGLENLLKNISTKGLYINMSVESDEEAEYAIKIAQSYGVK
jgi:5-methyltetrahydrofolate--homocysteine methyltransferase